VSCTGSDSHSMAMVVTAESGAFPGNPISLVWKSSWVNLISVPPFTRCADFTFGRSPLNATSLGIARRQTSRASRCAATNFDALQQYLQSHIELGQPF